MSFLQLSDNQLTGSIPELGDLSNMHALFLDDNQLSGPVPAIPPPPSTGTLVATLCPNLLDSVANANEAGWDAATQATPWWTSAGGTVCDSVFWNGFE